MQRMIAINAASCVYLVQVKAQTSLMFLACSGLTNCSGLIILDIFQTITQCHFYAELPP